MKLHYKNCDLDIIVHNFNAGYPAKIDGLPENCYPAEPDEIEWEVGRALMDDPYTPEEWSDLTRLEKDNYELIVDEMTRFNSGNLTQGEILDLENMVLEKYLEDV